MKALNEEDAKLFYILWKPLLDYVNKKMRVNHLKDIAHASCLIPEEVKEIASVLWDDTSIIDEYLADEGSRLTVRECCIVASWKNCINGNFIMERHLKKGTILIGENNEVYQVSGIISSFKEMFEGMPMPLMIKATLLPFEDVIITDGLIMSYPMMIGSGMKQMLKDTYMDAKTEGRIITRL